MEEVSKQTEQGATQAEDKTSEQHDEEMKDEEEDSNKMSIKQDSPPPHKQAS